MHDRKFRLNLIFRRLTTHHKFLNGEMRLQKCRSIWTHEANQFLKYEKKCKNDDDKYAVDVNWKA